MSTEIPGYEITEVLGEGGMATVYLATQLKFDRIVALKIMSPHLARDDSFRQRFMHEARVVAKISHPNIVAVYDVGEHDGFYYLSMEYHVGGDLKAKIEEGIKVKECLYIVKDICKALNFAHSNQIVHRDIKPDNVLFRADDSAVLADFGIAKALESENNLTQVGTMAGTPKYMSPEQALGKNITHQSDLYSVGIVLYEMFTGEAPYIASDSIATAIKHTTEPVPTLPPALALYQPLLDRFLAKDPKDRFASGNEAISALNELIEAYDSNKTIIVSNNMSDPGRTVFVQEGVPPVEGNSRRHLVLKLFAGIALAAITATLLFTMRQTPDAEQPADTILASPVETSDPTDPVETSVPTNPEIARLLGRFEDLYASNRLMRPSDENALLVTQKVLAIEPGNKQALENIQRIGQRYLELALQSARAGKFSQAIDYTNNAANLLGSEKTTATKMEIDRLQKNANLIQPAAVTLRDKMRVQALLRQAQEDLSQNRIRLPKGNNALEKYQEVLKIDPRNKEALKALAAPPFSMQ